MNKKSLLIADAKTTMEFFLGGDISICIHCIRIKCYKSIFFAKLSLSSIPKLQKSKIVKNIICLIDSDSAKIVRIKTGMEMGATGPTFLGVILLFNIL